MSERSDWLEMGREALEIEIEGLRAVRDDLDGGFTAAVELIAACTERLVVSGIGKSGLVGRKIAATFSSTGTPASFLHPVEGAHGDLGMIRPGDVVIAISNSGETDELNAILPSLRAMGAAIISITGNGESTMAELSDVVIRARVPREACPLNLAPTASTTAALAVGDALAACLIRCRSFDERAFKTRHPGGALGQRLARRVGEIMRAEDVPAVDEGATLGQALAALDSGRMGLVAVAGPGNELRGVISDGDVRRMAVSGDLDFARPATHVMTANPRTLSPEQSAAEAVDLMEAHQITVLPIVENGRLAGMIHLHDLLGKGRLKFAG